MQEPLFYTITAVTLVFLLIPAVSVFVQIGRAATPKDWLDAIPGIGLVLSLSVLPIFLDAGVAGVMFFGLLLLKRKPVSNKSRRRIL